MENQSRPHNHRSNFFVAYFYTIGLDFSSISEKLETGKLAHQPKILSKYPQCESLDFSEEIMSQICFPNGLNIETFTTPPEPQTFHFALPFLANDDENIYFSGILFYEQSIRMLKGGQPRPNRIYLKSSKDYSSLRNSMRQSSTVASNSNILNVIDINQSIKSFRLCETKSYTSNNFNSKMYDTELDHPTSQDKLEKHKTNVDLYFVEDEKGKSTEIFYIPKVMILVSYDMFYLEKASILSNLYTYISTDNSMSQPFEQHIHYLTYSIPMPPRGIFTIEANFLGADITLQNSKINSIPHMSIDMEFLFLTFSITEIVEIYKWVYLEQNVLVFGAGIHAVSTFIESLKNLLYPFKYSRPSLTILPNIMFGFLNQLKGCLFGINLPYNNQFFKSYNIDTTLYEKNTMIIDLDSKKLEFIYAKLSRSCVSLKNLNKVKVSMKKEIQYEVPDFPAKYKPKLIKRLKDLINRCGGNRRGSKISITRNTIRLSEYDEFFDSIRRTSNPAYKLEDSVPEQLKSAFIKEIFYYFNISLIKEYSQFMRYDNSKHFRDFSNLKTFFNSNEYINYMNYVFYAKDFYETLVASKMFFGFIKGIYFPGFSTTSMFNISSTVVDHLLLDEYINMKANKKTFTIKTETPFISSNHFNFDESTTYKVINPVEFNNKDFSTNSLINSQEFDNSKSKHIVDHFEYVCVEKNGVSTFGDYLNNEETGFYFKYYYIPELNQAILSKLQAPQSSNNYHILKQKISNILETLFKKDEIIQSFNQQGYTINIESTFQDSHYYIFYSWYILSLQVYISEIIESEREKIFKILIYAIEKIKCNNRKEVINLIFLAIFKHGTMENLLELYELLYKYNLLNITLSMLLIEKLMHSNRSSKVK